MMERRLVLGFHPQFKLVPLVLWLGERRVFFITLNESQTLAEGMKRVKLSTLWFILSYTVWLGVQDEVSGCFSLLFFFSKCHLCCLVPPADTFSKHSAVFCTDKRYLKAFYLLFLTLPSYPLFWCSAFHPLFIFLIFFGFICSLPACPPSFLLS